MLRGFGATVAAFLLAASAVAAGRPPSAAAAPVSYGAVGEPAAHEEAARALETEKAPRPREPEYDNAESLARDHEAAFARILYSTAAVEARLVEYFACEALRAGSLEACAGIDRWARVKCKRSPPCSWHYHLGRGLRWMMRPDPDPKTCVDWNLADCTNDSEAEAREICARAPPFFQNADLKGLCAAMSDEIDEKRCLLEEAHLLRDPARCPSAEQAAAASAICEEFCPLQARLLKALAEDDSAPVAGTPFAPLVDRSPDACKPLAAAALAAYRDALAAAKGTPSSPARAPVEWVTIPGGEFTMGDDAERDARPVRRLRVPAFQLARTETTVAQYAACVAAGACSEPARGPLCTWGREGLERHPVNCVRWDQAAAFAAWAGGRLPSEAEWEYAAQGAGKGWEYPWGGEYPSCRLAIVYDGAPGCGRNATWPVCSRPLGNSAQGLCDLGGNLWEWVQDWYHGSFAGAPADASAWERPAGTYRVYRGGSWYSNDEDLRAFMRYFNSPGLPAVFIGFRAARSPS